MLKKLLNGLVGVLLLSARVFFVAIVVFIVSSDVLPTIKNGSLNVETNSIILNRTWEGNEINLVLMAYTLLACAFAYGAIRALKNLASKR